MIVPVGSVLCFTNDTNPNNIYQGTTWQKIEGKFLLGSSSDYVLGSTGGESTHTLTVDEMPSHHHSVYRCDNTSGGTGGVKYDSYFAGRAYSSLTMTDTGGGQAHNNMPPYEVVNYWKRVA